MLASDKSCVHIGLDMMNIRTGTDTELPDYLASNPPLRSLYLQNNILNDNDDILIARALKHNTNLEELCLARRNNNVTEVGSRALRKAVYDDTSLNSVSDSNLTCSIDGVAFRTFSIPNNYRNTNLNRRRKIFNLLSARNAEERRRSRCSKLIPKVLESVYTVMAMNGHVLISMSDHYQSRMKYYGVGKSRSTQSNL